MAGLAEPPDDRIDVLYIAPWLELGGTNKGTIDWFRWLDRDRFRPSLVTTQVSENPWLADVLPYAYEVWPLPELLAGNDFPKFILDFIESRRVRLVHIMDSRLGFDLLPDIRALPDPPATVVQLHVEEHHRGGYVRYVTTRYGNLVDAFSVTSRQLADAIVRDYDVPRGRCRVIYTGIDAEREFSPSRIGPAVPREAQFEIVYPARLVEQKDPLLLVHVAAALRKLGVDFRINCIGDGGLEPEVRAEVDRRGLESKVLLRGAQRGIAPWLAAADAMVLTSLFEGVPYVAFEAMAMGVPFVAPALPGLVEIVRGEEGLLIDPRDDADAYAAALARMAADKESRARMGADGRTLALGPYSIRNMARAHEELYDELLSRSGRHSTDQREKKAPSTVIRCRGRTPGARPRVSVVTPCHDDGRYLPACLESIRVQSYDDVEIIVVDDASTDAETCALLDQLESDPSLRVLRQPENRGPGSARNAGIEVCTGRYVLPVDADNQLVPEALGCLVDQLQEAGEQIGFVYPNLQFFGNRTDYYEAPDYNLYALLEANFCDTCSLFDRELFDAGVRYCDDIKMAHEDWNLALQLAARGVWGERARHPTLLFRKRGYSRGDTAWYGIDGAYRLGAHPPNLQDRSDRDGTVTAIKARWSPGLSILPLEPLAGERPARLTRSAGRQSCADFELLVQAEHELAVDSRGPRLRRLAAADSPAAALAGALTVVRGRYALATYGDGLELLADPSFVEKVLRTFMGNPSLRAIAFTDAGEEGRFPYRLLRRSEGLELAPHAVAWERHGPDALAGVPVATEPLAEVVVALHLAGAVQWRHLPDPGRRSGRADPRPRIDVDLRERPGESDGTGAEQWLRLGATPLLPRAPRLPPRLADADVWVPPGAQPVFRHKEPISGRRFVSRAFQSPEGYVLEHVLGVTWTFPLAGTKRLRAVPSDAGQEFITEDPSAGDLSLDSEGHLGHVESMPFAMLQPVVLVRVAATGQHTLAAGANDPLGDGCERLGWVCSIDSYPMQPQLSQCEDLGFGVVGVVRAVDRAARVHRIGFGRLPEGVVEGELGALLKKRPEAGVPVHVDGSGLVSTPAYTPAHSPAGLVGAARWSGAPATWRDIEIPVAARSRAVARRGAASLTAALRGSRNGRGKERVTAGYLHSTNGSGRIPLYSSVHPVTGDQMLSTSRLEGSDMGYAGTARLGYLAPRAPVTGSLRLDPVPVSWASRFGMRARRS